MVKREKSNYIIQSVSHALDVLEEFKGDIVELGVTELSKKLKLHKNNVFRLLATLESRGYIEQNKSTENYHLGLRSLELGQTFIKQMGLLRQAKPIIERLCDDCGETTYLAIMRNQDVIYLDVAEASQTVRVASRVGLRLPTYCTAAGKVVIAFRPEEEIKKFLPDGLEKKTPGTIVDEKRLMDHLKKVAKQGYAIDNEEFEVGVKCVAAPVRDYTGQVIAGISVSGPMMRMDQKKISETVIPAVLNAGEQLSRRLGHNLGED
ncbi:IclR family transcriptional regulator [Thermodesulfobacteriota bacterium]